MRDRSKRRISERNVTHSIFVGLVCFAVSFAAATDKIAVRCDLETRIIGKTQSAEQSASQRLESLAHAPAGIKDLPSGLGKDVRFFLIRIGDKDRPIIVDVREGRQTTFILYADINGNGRLSDEKPYTAKPIPSGWFGNDRFRFGPVAIESELDGKKTSVSFNISTTDGDVLGVFPFQCLKGDVVLGGDTYTLTIIDGNLDGRCSILPFTQSTGPAGLDSISVLKKGSNPIDMRYSGLLPLTRMLRIYDTYYDIELEPTGQFIALKEAAMDYGKLSVGDTFVRMQLWSDLAGQAVWGQGEWKLPVAQYRILNLEICRSDNKGVWSMTESGSAPTFKAFEIHKDKTTQIPIDKEIQILTYVSGVDKNGLCSVSFNLVGTAGQRYNPALYLNGKRQPAPGIRILDEGDNVLTIGRLKYG